MDIVACDVALVFCLKLGQLCEELLLEAIDAALEKNTEDGSPA